MNIQSNSFANDAEMPDKYTCKGEDVSPELLINDVPAEAVELVLVMNDPDAPSGNWVHWVVYGIDPKNPNFPEGVIPSGAKIGIGTSGESKYSGPCPPSGTHHYIFTVYALNQSAELLGDSHYATVISAISDKTIDQAQYIGLYTKK